MAWLFWINITELQTKFTSEITVNIDNSCTPIKCTNVRNQLTGHCYCPKTGGEFKIVYADFMMVRKVKLIKITFAFVIIAPQKQIPSTANVYHKKIR